MQDHELARARDAIPPLLDSVLRDGGDPLSAPQLVDALRGEGIGEEAVRLAMWYLIDHGAIELMPDWRVRPRHVEVSVQ